MRIAIFSDNFYPELSGISDSIISFGRQLGKTGHIVRYYVPNYSDEDYKRAGKVERELNLGPNVSVVRFASISVKAGSDQGRLVIPTGLRWLHIRRFRPEIIHAQLFFGVGIEALIAAKILGIPFVGTNHTATKEFLRYNPVRAAWADKLVLRYVNWYYNKCDFLSAPSSSVFKDMEQYGLYVPHRPISNPLDTETFKPLTNKTKLQKEYGFTNKTIVYAGRIADEKNIDIILHAVALLKKKIPSLMFVLAGHGPAQEKLKAQARLLRISESVKFLGLLSQPTLARVYNASSLFVITSTSETQSLVMMQAFACGIPTVGVRAHALPEYINDKNGVLVNPGNPSELADALLGLLKSPTKLRSLGKSARAFAEKFSTAKIAHEWEKIYRDVVARNIKT